MSSTQASSTASSAGSRKTITIETAVTADDSGNIAATSVAGGQTETAPTQNTSSVTHTDQGRIGGGSSTGGSNPSCLRPVDDGIGKSRW